VKRRQWAALLGVVFIIFLFAATARSDEPFLHPVMRPDKATRDEWLRRYNAAPQAFLTPHPLGATAYASSIDLSSHLSWNASNMSQRNQGCCGNCWVWSGTGVMEVALDVQTGAKDRLSEQFVNSCKTGLDACSGGWLDSLVSFYAGKGYAIPWSNSGASWQESLVSWPTCTGSRPACSAISTSPRYSISSVSLATIATQGVSNSEAINNIKNVLNQNKAVWFGFFMPTGADWDAFDASFWANQPESSVWTPNICGQTWDVRGGGHAVLCVGYSDTDPNNRYWIMLNSWGTNSNRPNGLFRVSMDLNYGCKDADNDPTFYFQTLDITYGSGNHAPNIPSSPSPAHGATGVAPSVTLSWTGGDPDQDAVTYRVVLDTIINNPTAQVCSGSATSCATGTLAPGTDYYWRVYATDEHGASTAGPVWHFRTTDAWNDDFDHALSIPYVPYSYTEDTTAASPNPTQLISDDPTFTCGTYFVSAQGSHSVWFSYTPAAAGVITATTLGSDYDTVLAVWTGSRGALQEVTCNDDVDLSYRWSQVQIPAAAGTTYYIEVADYNAASNSGGGGTLKVALLPEMNRRGYLPIILKNN
jgi:hypothetical protein